MQGDSGGAGLTLNGELLGINVGVEGIGVAPEAFSHGVLPESGNS